MKNLHRGDAHGKLLFPVPQNPEYYDRKGGFDERGTMKTHADDAKLGIRKNRLPISCVKWQGLLIGSPLGRALFNAAAEKCVFGPDDPFNPDDPDSPGHLNLTDHWICEGGHILQSPDGRIQICPVNGIETEQLFSRHICFSLWFLCGMGTVDVRDHQFVRRESSDGAKVGPVMLDTLRKGRFPRCDEKSDNGPTVGQHRSQIKYAQECAELEARLHPNDSTPEEIEQWRKKYLARASRHALELLQFDARVKGKV